MTDFEQRYAAARKAVIARDLARLNPMQRQGAMTTGGRCCCWQAPAAVRPPCSSSGFTTF